MKFISHAYTCQRVAPPWIFRDIPGSKETQAPVTVSESTQESESRKELNQLRENIRSVRPNAREIRRHPREETLEEFKSSLISQKEAIRKEAFEQLSHDEIYDLLENSKDGKDRFVRSTAGRIDSILGTSKLSVLAEHVGNTFTFLKNEEQILLETLFNDPDGVSDEYKLFLSGKISELYQHDSAKFKQSFIHQEGNTIEFDFMGIHIFQSDLDATMVLEASAKYITHNGYVAVRGSDGKQAGYFYLEGPDKGETVKILQGTTIEITNNPALTQHQIEYAQSFQKEEKDIENLILNKFEVLQTAEGRENIKEAYEKDEAVKKTQTRDVINKAQKLDIQDYDPEFLETNFEATSDEYEIAFEEIKNISQTRILGITPEGNIKLSVGEAGQLIEMDPQTGEKFPCHLDGHKENLLKSDNIETAQVMGALLEGNLFSSDLGTEEEAESAQSVFGSLPKAISKIYAFQGILGKDMVDGWKNAQIGCRDRKQSILVVFQMHGALNDDGSINMQALEGQEAQIKNTIDAFRVGNFDALDAYLETKKEPKNKGTQGVPTSNIA